MAEPIERTEAEADSYSTARELPAATWNRTESEYPTGVCLHELVEAQVQRTPDRTALVFDGGRLSYAELAARARRVAAHLRELGVGPETPVGVCIERSPELVVALLAVLQAGGAYLPLDPEYPRRRLELMAEDAGIGVVLTHGATAGTVPDGPRPLRVDDVWRAEGEPPSASGVDEQNLAYVMYTSGSTGRPKGVMIEHRSIVNRLFWMQDHYGLDGDDVAIQKTPFSFDVSVWEFFWPLMTGARLVIPRAGGHKDAGYLARLVDREGVTVMHFVPSMLDLFLEDEGVGARCRSLEHVICSGEALTRDLVDRFFERMPAGVELWNLYGPTEAAVDVTWWKCEPESSDRTVPIGRPVANTRIHVVDADLQPLPAGEVGELVIAGVQVGRGYWNRPELTAEKFMPDTLGGGPGERLYRTGDLARWREDGVVEFLGRVDHQVKIRGQRVELGEIEAVLRERPGVLQAAAVVREDRPGDPRLVGYVVPEDGTPLDEERLREELAGELPEVMVPSRFVVLEEMPLSPNGKLDRGALPEPDRRRPDLSQPYVEPRDDLEAYLADLWSDVLGLDRVGIHDPFFEIGGSSLHAARVVNRLQEELDRFIYVVTVFDASTVAEYADFLSRDYPEEVRRRFGVGGDEAGPETPPGEAAAADDARPATIEEDDVGGLQAAVPQVPLAKTRGNAAALRNDPAIFILAPPRSGTTLLRVMLAGHPDLFAAAELQLLHFETLAQRSEAFTGRFSVWREGVIRALMELEGWEPDRAQERMDELAGRDLGVREFYGLLQERLEGRTLVEKTPSYALDPLALDRAERDFRDPLYVHLSRHPYAMVESFVSYHMDQILFLDDHPFDARQLGELVWLLSHRNVETFLEGVPDDRQVRLRFEDLVREPGPAMRELCRRLGLPFHPNLLRPYQDLEGKMVDGVHDDSTPMGDTKLLERKGIDPSVAEKWKGVLDDDYLGEPTWRLAVALGYERPRTRSDRAPSDGRSAGSGPPPAPRRGSADPKTAASDGGTLGRRGALRRRRLSGRRGDETRGAGAGDGGE